MSALAIAVIVFARLRRRDVRLVHRRRVAQHHLSQSRRTSKLGTALIAAPSVLSSWCRRQRTPSTRSTVNCGECRQAITPDRILADYGLETKEVRDS
jgi:hypothetical protein